jgi:hypothetical protein
MLLTRIVEEISGEPFSRFMEQRVFHLHHKINPQRPETAVPVAFETREVGLNQGQIAVKRSALRHPLPVRWAVSVRRDRGEGNRVNTVCKVGKRLIYLRGGPAV